MILHPPHRPYHPLPFSPSDMILSTDPIPLPQSEQEPVLLPRLRPCLLPPPLQSQWRQRQKRGSGTRLTNPVGLSPRNWLLACSHRSPSLPRSRGPVEAVLQQRMYVTVIINSEYDLILASISIIRYPTGSFLVMTRKATTSSYQMT